MLHEIVVPRDLTLDSALKIIQVIETAAEQQKKLMEAGGANVHVLKKERKQRFEKTLRTFVRIRVVCGTCGRKHKKYNCPAYNKSQAVGHF